MKKPNSKFQIPNSQSGLASLPTILALSILILTIVIAITAWSLSESFVTQSQTFSQMALAYSEAGARDALTRIARNPSYTCSSPDPCYTIDMVASGCSASNDGCAKVLVTASGLNRTITSTGVAKTSTRQVQVTAIISINGEITSTAWCTPGINCP